MTSVFHKRAEQARNGRDVFTDAYYDRINWLIKSINERTFGQNHFDTAQKLFHSIESVVATEIDVADQTPATTLSRSVLTRFYLFYQDCGRHQQPCHINFVVSQKNFKYSEIWYPLLLGLENVSRTHVSGSGHLFTPDAAHDLIASSLYLSRLLAKIPELQGSLASPRGLSLFLADKYGLYLCQAKHIMPGEHDPYLVLDYTRGHICEGGPVHPTEMPSVRICANTFIGLREMTGHQKRIYDLVRDICDNPEMSRALDAVANNFLYPDLRSKVGIVAEASLTAEKAQIKLGGQPVQAPEIGHFLNDWKKGEASIPLLEEKFRKMLQHPDYQWVFTRDQNLLPEPASFDLTNHRPPPRIDPKWLQLNH